LPSVLGAGTLPVRLRVKNLGERAARIPRATMSFEVSRDGVRFPCESRDFVPREPTLIEERETVWLDRELDCALPILGRYDVRSMARFDDDPVSEEVG